MESGVVLFYWSIFSTMNAFAITISFIKNPFLTTAAKKKKHKTVWKKKPGKH
jgi:hypothetical protein